MMTAVLQTGMTVSRMDMSGPEAAGTILGLAVLAIILALIALKFI